MMMRHKPEDFYGYVSAKGCMQLDRIAYDEAVLKRDIGMAGRRITAGNPAAAVWMILLVDTGRELTVQKLLNVADIEASAPTCKGPARRRKHRVIPPSDQPVFTGYTLVRCVPSNEAIRALSTFEHVRGVVGGWCSPHFVSGEEVSKFIAMAESGAYDWEAPASVFTNGRMVLVKEGPFVGFEGQIVAFGGAGKGTPVIELSIFGRPSPTLIPIAMLQAL